MIDTHECKFDPVDGAGLPCFTSSGLGPIL
jgi:hypothetical protein